ncbi:MAG: YvcK family protein [Candidatus Obscuribacterales bacterium]|nr:YvcK family protein [Candidatus Obscuribacterales bacterium]
MKDSWQYRLRVLILPGIKRWILFILVGIITIVLGVLLILEEHPVRLTLNFINAILSDTTKVLPHKISGIIAMSLGAIVTTLAVVRLAISILGAYLPEDRESIPDRLYRRRHLARGPRIVVIGGGTGLSNLLSGLKGFTNNITAIVTVGDDGGSSGRLRQELGVLPPGDIRNCITALADEEKLVTELFRYRFKQGNGLEGHSFGNLFLSAVCGITGGDMLEAARVASRVLNSCGQVLPSTLSNVALVAELENGDMIRGESHIPEAQSRISTLRCEPQAPKATPQALEAIKQADFLILGPGSLYTSIIPNLLVDGIPEAIRQSKAPKIYVCNVMTQKGETTGFTVADHVQALLSHAGYEGGSQASTPGRFIDRVLVNSLDVEEREELAALGVQAVKYDSNQLRQLGVRPMLRSVGSKEFCGHHDPAKLASALILWYFRLRGKRFWFKRKTTNNKSSVAASL